MAFTFTFIQLFAWGVYLIAPLLGFFLLIVLSLGLIVGRIEGWSRFDALYWAFITAFTVGYGDMRPLKRWSRVLSVVIALHGILLTGLLVAVTVQTSTKAFEMHIDPAELKRIEQQLR
ncbi:potassium channel family protein [Marinobacterium jannaschii]|uniref:potassium channel family protein n=1 Tax=Marinobacterium jannaschii TaxID=64970 RepID=UPI000483EFF1|nr:potassium channel family protein [Marinobacterium jannaschii]